MSKLVLTPPPPPSHTPTYICLHGWCTWMKTGVTLGVERREDKEDGGGEEKKGEEEKYIKGRGRRRNGRRNKEGEQRPYVDRSSVVSEMKTMTIS